MSARAQQYLTQLKASETISFYNRPKTVLNWALIASSVLVVVLFMLYVGFTSTPPTPLTIQLCLLPVLILATAASVYNFKNYYTRPVIIAVSKAGIDYLGNHLPWSAVDSVRVEGEPPRSLFIELADDRKTKVRFFGVYAQNSKIPILLTALEYPEEFVQCIKASAGNSFKG